MQIKFYSILSVLLAAFSWSCNTQGENKKQVNNDQENNVFVLRLNPTPASGFKYEIIGEQETELRLSGKEVNNPWITKW